MTAEVFDCNWSGTDRSSVCVWRFLDGKAGHRNQVLGLTDAIGRIVQVDCHDIDVSRALSGIKSLLLGRLSALDDLPIPALLVGAGHATHIPMLASRRRYGGRTIVLMKPSLPLFLFDMCLIPAADDLKRVPRNVIITEGALNRIQPSETLESQRGLILIGGPSSHFGWADHDVLVQVKSVIESNPQIEWTLTTSRRTPTSFVAAWHASRCRGQMVPVDQTGSDWLPKQLKSAATVWVTNESVSMIHEALTSGASVGILTLPESRRSRVTRGIDSLITRNLVTPFARWQASSFVEGSGHTLDEAHRCAKLVAQTFLLQPDESVMNQRRVA